MKTTTDNELTIEVNKLIRIWTISENVSTFDDLTNSQLYYEYLMSREYEGRNWTIPQLKVVLKEFLYQSKLPSTLKTLEFWGIV